MHCYNGKNTLHVGKSVVGCEHLRSVCGRPACCSHMGEALSASICKSKLWGCFVQLCQMCQEHDDIVLLKVDWDQNKAIARPLAVKVNIS